MERLIKGQIIIELLVAFGLAGILIPAILSGLIGATNGKAQQQQRIIAVGYLKEGEEAVRDLRNSDWSNIAKDDAYYPVVTSGVWTLSKNSTNGNLNGGFTRSVVISSIGTPSDPSIKRILITVSWGTGSSVNSTLYLARWKSQWSPQQPAGGPLIGEGFGDWCNPSATPAAQLALAGGLNVVFAAQAVGGGNVVSFVGSGNNASGGPLVDINITDPTHPIAPVPTVVANVNNNPQIKTNGAFNDVSYAYLAADQHGGNGQGLIVDLSKLISDPSHSIVGSLDIGTSKEGQSIYVNTANNIAFLTATDGYMYAFNVATKTGSHAPITGSKIQLSGVGKKVVIVGNTAYVATDSTQNQFQIFDVTTPSAPIKTADISMGSKGNTKPGVDVYVDPVRLRAYLVTDYASASVPDFFTIDVNPLDTWYKQIINTFITVNNMNPAGVVAVTASRAVIVGTGSTRNYQVIDDTAEGVPAPALTTCGSGGLSNTNYDINGIATLFTKAQRAYSYIITKDNGLEYKIIEGGPGGGAGGSGGTYELTPPFDAGHSVVFNSFTATASITPTGDFTVNYQIAVAQAPCSTAGYNYVGSYPATGGLIPININPGQCFRYKAIFSNAGTATSATANVSVNYSP